MEKGKLQNTGWNTTDADEIIRRQERAAVEKINVISLDRTSYYGSYTACSAEHDITKYLIEIRSLNERTNSCSCLDFQTNGLGTCKHIEKILLGLKKRGIKKFTQAMQNKSPWIEIFLTNQEDSAIASNVKIIWPKNLSLHPKIDSYFSNSGFLMGDPIKTIPFLKKAIQNLDIRKQTRFSAHIDEWYENLLKERHRQALYEDIISDIKTGKRIIANLKYPLYPYQQEGVLHLALKERALLADEMGLGKTIQAIGACELLRHLKGVERVLVIATASLKAEWEEQITKFTDLKVKIIRGNRICRIRQYQEPAFYYLTNYEQILYDGMDIQRLLKPDVIILDEAQRIKNWQTKAAKSVKRLRSPYAFVLTGTPLENRIDDIFSIVQFLNPHLLGALFRFNRKFYSLDEKGRPIGYKNLDELHRIIKPIMLRRSKADVEEQLPDRSVNHYFVVMEKEQLDQYKGYNDQVAALVVRAKKRPLLKEEFEKLQRCLACMRMLCDTPYILNENCRVSPKLRELEKILGEILEDQQAKVLIFSEWERMLMLVRELARKMQIEYSWHTGSVPQIKRREEIKRFKENPNCRLFLSTDSGSVGLNLQTANIVINLDLPWNPAKLEQRIARAWRKHQTRNVQVINLVAEDTIEHRMIGLLAQKSALTKNVLEDGTIKEMQAPSGRAAFMERLETLMTNVKPVKSALDQFKSDCPDELLALEKHQNNVFALIKNDNPKVRKQLEQNFIANKLNQNYALDIIDQKSLNIIKRLIELGVISANKNFESLFMQARKACDEQRLLRMKKSQELLSTIEKKYNAAKLLIENDFCQEAILTLKVALEKTISLLAYANDLCDDTKTMILPDLRSLEMTNIDHDLLTKSYALCTNTRQISNLEVKQGLSMCKSLLDFLKENLTGVSRNEQIL